MARAVEPQTHARDEVEAVAALGRTRVVIVGGGINGIATFRDLALQGVDVVLVERADFASGATAASSHMIHGGIRYLENGEFRLVRESVRERNDLLRTAPHFVRPLQTTIPIYATFAGILSAPLRFLTHRSGAPSERGAVLIKIGLVFYDFFSRGGREVPRHRFARRRRTHEQLPALDPKVKYSATYFDAGVRDPERLAIDVLLDGLAAHPGAHAVSYVEAIGSSESGVRLRDRETGREFDLAADVVVNATGPWADLTNAALGMPSQLTGGTKGSHIVLDHPELLAATGGREIFFEHEDGRIVLIYPLRDRVLVGTTDLPADPAEPAVCTEEEVDYFFALVRHVFPAIEVDRSSIVYRFSGIRPLPRHGDLQPGFVSRDYRVETVERPGAPPVLTLVGGKWTTFRALGESLADRVLALLGAERRTGTLGRGIGGGRDFPRDPAAWRDRHLAGQSPARREVLFERYGTRAREVAAELEAGDDVLLLDGAFSERELGYLVRTERVVHLADLVFRRSDLAFAGRVDREAVEELGAAVARAADWDDLRLDREIEDCLRLLREHGAAIDGVASARPSSP
jgi:glycerol-3-phosphate dehydrogenase